jgi:hypothetical protein
VLNRRSLLRDCLRNSRSTHDVGPVDGKEAVWT